MLFIRRSFVVLVFSIGASSMVIAQDQPPEGAAESVAEETSEESKPASDGAGADREWAKRKSKINVLEAKMKELTKKIKGYIEIKRTGAAALDEKGRPIDVLAAIVTTHRELKEAVVEHGNETRELRFRFPEKGELIQRKYIPMRVQTLEQIENEMGLSGELTQIKKKIDKKYSAFVGDQLVKPVSQESNHPESTIKEIRPTGNEPQKLKLSK